MNENISKNIWQVFELASQAGKEAEALLDLIGSSLTDKIFSSIKEIRCLGKNTATDETGWVRCNETRSYGVIPKRKQTQKYVIGVQVVFYDPESNITSNQAVLNICLQRDESGEAFGAENWFCLSGWEGYSVQTNGMTIANFNDANEFSALEYASDIYFSIPLGALNGLDAVKLKVISPLQALLNHLDPNASEVVEAFNYAKDIIKLDAIRFQNSTTME